MSELTPQLIAEVVATCEQNAADIADALARGLDAEVTVKVGEPTTYASEAVRAGLASAGLVMKLQFGEVAIAVALPESSGLTRGWMQEPDITGESMLNTLAQELSMLVVPESMIADKFGAWWVTELTAVLQQSDLAGEASVVPLLLEGDGQEVPLYMAWPCAKPAALLPPPKPKEPEIKVEEVKAAPPPPPPPKPKRLEELPSYARHLLKITVPVSVRLVAKKLSVGELLELGPGAMISFDKSCDDTLQLTVGDHVVAEGSAVKVGEHFGLEIESITLPEEHFRPVRKTG